MIKYSASEIKRAYKIIAENNLPEFTFGEFVKIHKMIEIEDKTLNLLPTQETIPATTNNLPTNKEVLPATRVSKDIDYCGLFICPTVRGLGKEIDCLVVTVSNKEEVVSLDRIESWLEPINRNTAFFNRSAQLQQYFNCGIEKIDLKEVKSPYWQLTIRYKYGSTLIDRLRESKIKYGLPCTS